MSDKNVIIEKEAGIITVALNRPDALNALNDALMDFFTYKINYV